MQTIREKILHVKNQVQISKKSFADYLENEEFKNFFKYLSEHNVEFKIPSRRAISAQIK